MKKTIAWNLIQFLIFLLFVRFLGIGIIFLGSLIKQEELKMRRVLSGIGIISTFATCGAGNIFTALVLLTVSATCLYLGKAFCEETWEQVAEMTENLQNVFLEALHDLSLSIAYLRNSTLLPYETKLIASRCKISESEVFNVLETAKKEKWSLKKQEE